MKFVVRDRNLPPETRPVENPTQARIFRYGTFEAGKYHIPDMS